MKKWLTLLLVMFTLTAFPDYSSAQMQKMSNKQKKELIKMAVKEKIDKKQIRIDINRVIPMGGTPKNTSNQYSLDLIDGVLGCYLPFFGSSSTAPIGSSDISFRTENQKVDYELEYNEKKGNYTIRFEFDNDNMNNRCKATIKITSTGICTIHITSTHMGSMDYNGGMKL